MNSDLVLTQDGSILYVQNAPFAKDVTRVEFFSQTGTLIIIFEDEDSRMVECEIFDPAVKKALGQLPTIILTHVKDGKIQDGFDVPLVAILA